MFYLARSRGFALVAALPFVVVCAYVAIQALSLFVEQQRTATHTDQQLMLREAAQTGLQLALYGHTQSAGSATVWRTLVAANADVVRCVNSEGALVSHCDSIFFNSNRAIQVQLTFTVSTDSAGNAAIYVDEERIAWRQLDLVVSARNAHHTTQLTAVLLMRSVGTDGVVLELLRIAS